MLLCTPNQGEQEEEEEEEEEEGRRRRRRRRSTAQSRTARWPPELASPEDLGRLRRS